IWKLTAKGRPLVEKQKLAGASIEQLLEDLKAPEDYTRRQARLVLREMDHAKVAAGREKWVAGLGREEEFARLQALWTYQTINVPNVVLLKELLRAKDAGIRVAATRVLRGWVDPVFNAQPAVADGLGLLEVQVADAHPRVRLE